MAKAHVSKITVSVGSHTFELSLEEARALKDELNKVLEPKVVFPERIIEKEVYRPWHPPYWASGMQRQLSSDPPSLPETTIICKSDFQGMYSR